MTRLGSTPPASAPTGTKSGSSVHHGMTPAAAASSAATVLLAPAAVAAAAAEAASASPSCFIWSAWNCRDSEARLEAAAAAGADVRAPFRSGAFSMGHCWRGAPSSGDVPLATAMLRDLPWLLGGGGKMIARCLPEAPSSTSRCQQLSDPPSPP